MMFVQLWSPQFVSSFHPNAQLFGDPTLIVLPGSGRSKKSWEPKLKALVSSTTTLQSLGPTNFQPDRSAFTYKLRMFRPSLWEPWDVEFPEFPASSTWVFCGARGSEGSLLLELSSCKIFKNKNRSSRSFLSPDILTWEGVERKPAWSYVIFLPYSLSLLLFPLVFTLLPHVFTQHSHSIVWKLQPVLTNFQTLGGAGGDPGL